MSGFCGLDAQLHNLKRALLRAAIYGAIIGVVIFSVIIY